VDCYFFIVFTFRKLDFITFKCTSFSRKGNGPNLRPLFLTVKALNLANILFLDEENLNFIAGTLYLFKDQDCYI